MAREKIWSKKSNPDQATANKLGMKRYDLGTAIETIKGAAGLAGADAVDLYSNGDVVDQMNGEIIGNVHDELL